MKIAVIGAGSTRLPLMLASIAKASRRVDEVSLFDTRPWRVDALLPVAEALAGECGSMPRVRVAKTALDALDGAGFMILTIRPGFEEARARDERACLDMGVIGQETTGPAGLAFAFRSIPACLEYCGIAQRVGDSCVPVVFTNPAGLVTQAMHARGFDRAIGVCDSASAAAAAVAGRAGLDVSDTDFEVYGLNHLSWTRRVQAGGRDLLAEAMGDRAFLSTAFPYHSPGELSASGRIPNEYLYYYYRAGHALEAMRKEGECRGEALAFANKRLFAGLTSVSALDSVADGLVVYANYITGRNDSYMAYAGSRGTESRRIRTPGEAIRALKTLLGGYAEVALDLAAAMEGEGRGLLALNVPGRGCIPGLDPGDVVETDCMVGPEGPSPRSHRDLPDEDMALVLRVKEYERLAVDAVLEGSLDKAVMALAAHPLVESRETAVKLVAALGLDARREESAKG